MLPLLLVAVIFVAVVMAVFAFGAAVVTPSSVLGARLRALGGQQQQQAENRPAFRERMEQALDPISRAIPLSPADVSRTRGWLIQAGFRDAMDVNYYFGARLLMAGAGFIGVALFTGLDNLFLLAGVAGLGFFLPRSSHSHRSAGRPGPYRHLR